MIKASELKFQSTKSRGPGGQHVNRSETAMILRWNVWETRSFSMDQKLRIMEKLGPKLTESGELIVRSDQFKSQLSNKKACLEKLHKILKQALHRPKLRKKTKPTRASKERRLENKKYRSKIKKLRKNYED